MVPLDVFSYGVTPTNPPKIWGKEGGVWSKEEKEEKGGSNFGKLQNGGSGGIHMKPCQLKTMLFSGLGFSPRNSFSASSVYFSAYAKAFEGGA